MQRAFTRRKDYLRARFESFPQKHGDEVLEDFVKYRFDSEDNTASFIRSVFNESNPSNEEASSLDDDDASYYSTDDDFIETGHPLGVRNRNRLIGAIPES